MTMLDCKLFIFPWRLVKKTENRSCKRRKMFDLAKILPLKDITFLELECDNYCMRDANYYEIYH